MNLPRIYLIAMMLFASGVGANGQDPPKAVLVDEFGKLECEDLIARQDNLFHELNQNPNYIGYAIISSDETTFRQARYTEAMFDGQTEFRRFDDFRFRVLRATGLNGLKVQLRVVPAGANIPQIIDKGWDFKIKAGSKPYRFNVSEYDKGPCPVGSQFKLYSATLKANPSAKGHIVVWARIRSQFLNEKARVQRDLVKKYGVNPSQIKYFHIPNRSKSVKWEYWIVPAKGK